MSDEENGLYEISDADYSRIRQEDRKVVGIFARESRKADATMRERENTLIDLLYGLIGEGPDLEQKLLFEAQEKGLNYQGTLNALMTGKENLLDLGDKRSDEEVKANIERLEQRITRARLEKDLDA
ncbi:hypothetical protein F3I62_18990 [Pseudomonas sp. R-28-1W-6]|uniref:hypothetical protein n=1 Tax=Pseudomonas sp. R-28-1W-6 TaxID=2650101 RepID=UPI00136676D9|nr:hypothetical protein [Pseudomonas sp. R-28-1W-6]MWV14192.1 hypothetical protein [Pseudomonas sp. R-28-1W-6]